MNESNKSFHRQPNHNSQSLNNAKRLVNWHHSIFLLFDSDFPVHFIEIGDGDLWAIEFIYLINLEER